MSQGADESKRNIFLLEEPEDAQKVFEHYLQEAKDQQLELRNKKVVTLLMPTQEELDKAYERLEERWKNAYETHKLAYSNEKNLGRYKSSLAGELKLLADQCLKIQEMIVDFEKHGQGSVLKVASYDLAFIRRLEAGFEAFKEKPSGCLSTTAVVFLGMVVLLGYEMSQLIF